MDRMDRMSATRPDLGPQRYERSGGSFAGTSRSIETRVTSGHSDTSSNSIPSKPDNNQQHERVPSVELTEGRDSASIYDRDLPAPPDAQVQERPFSSATRDAEELVEAYSSHDRESTEGSHKPTGEDPYDGLADDENTSDGHQDGSLTRDSFSPASRDLPTPPVKGLTVTPPKFLDDEDPAPATVRRPLRSVSPDLREVRRESKPLPSP